MIGVPTLTFPVNPERAAVAWVPATLSFRSAWTGQETRVRRYGQWTFRYDWATLTRADYGALMALFNRFSDQQFTTYDIARTDPTGNATAAMMSFPPASAGPDPTHGLLVNGAGQTGQTLNLKNSPVSTICFRAGDLIGMAGTGEMYEVSATASSDGAGLLTVQLNQFIRTSPGNSEDVVVSYVPCKVWIRRPATADISDAPPLWAVSAEMIEAL